MSIIREQDVSVIRSFYRLSCEELGALMNVSGRFISHIERGTRNLPKIRADMLAKELSITPEKLARIYEYYEESTL